MTTRLELFIGGQRRSPRTDRYLDVWDPATGGVLAQVPLCGTEDAHEAVAAAAAAFEPWAETPVPERARVMFRLQALIQRDLDHLATLIVQENGKALDEARGEVRRGLEVVEFAAGMPSLMMGNGLEQVARGVDTDMYRYPVGVVAGITPFNFPVMIPLWMAPIAIAAGNTFVLKPSQRTPLSAMRLAELFSEAGLPDGVFNVVHGAEDAANALIDHPAVKAVSFVGSEAGARAVYARAAEGIFSSAFANAGQRCLAGSVLMPVGEIADALVERLVDLARTAPMGSGLDPQCVMTPVTTEVHKQRVLGWIERGLQEGARLVVDGREPSVRTGFFVGPTILDHVHPEMSIAQEEIFGPVLVVERVPDLETAIQVINRSRFGNAAVIYTGSGLAARTFRRRVHAGMIGVNVGVPAPMAFFPFAGWKNSFFGDLHATGRDAVEFFTERKVITSRWY